MEAKLLPIASPAFDGAKATRRRSRAPQRWQVSASASAFPVTTPALRTVSGGMHSPLCVAFRHLGRGEAAERCKASVSSVEETQAGKETAAPVRGVLFDMDGVLCNSEEPSRDAAVALFAEMGLSVKAADFIPFMGTGEANFLGGVARAYGLESFDVAKAKLRFFEIYIEKYAKPNSGLGYPGALELILQCKKAGLKLAVASSADRVKVDANLAAAGLPQANFDAVVSADLFENLKPAPDIFFAAARALELPPQECVVIEDALAGVQAARAAGMRCVAVTTTLAEEKLKPAGPSLVRKDISEVSLDDLLTLDEPGSGL